jgi:uncharacterized membrane protein YgdD (TMEM256/DUF423 family)
MSYAKTFVGCGLFGVHTEEKKSQEHNESYQHIMSDYFGLHLLVTKIAGSCT